MGGKIGSAYCRYSRTNTRPRFALINLSGPLGIRDCRLREIETEHSSIGRRCVGHVMEQCIWLWTTR